MDDFDDQKPTVGKGNVPTVEPTSRTGTIPSDDLSGGIVTPYIAKRDMKMYAITEDELNSISVNWLASFRWLQLLLVLLDRCG